MNREEIRHRLIQILRSTEFEGPDLDPSEVLEETPLLDGIINDSLQLLDFIVAIENAFSVKLTTEYIRIDDFERFGYLIDLVALNLVANSTKAQREWRAKETS